MGFEPGSPSVRGVETLKTPPSLRSALLLGQCRRVLCLVPILLPGKSQPGTPSDRVQILNLEGGSKGPLQRAHKGSTSSDLRPISGGHAGSFSFSSSSLCARDRVRRVQAGRGGSSPSPAPPSPAPLHQACALLSSVRLTRLQVEGAQSVSWRSWDSGLPRAPAPHAVGAGSRAGAGGLAPELPFLPVLPKNSAGKDAAHSVRQCWGGRLCRRSSPLLST